MTPHKDVFRGNWRNAIQHAPGMSMTDLWDGIIFSSKAELPFPDVA